MSLSSTEARICVYDRSAATRNSSGADRLAATVWPTSTVRAITVPDGSFQHGGFEAVDLPWEMKHPVEGKPYAGWVPGGKPGK